MQSDTPNLTYTIQGHEFKAPPLAAGLHLVATPLGNLADVSLRSLAVLAAEDIVLPSCVMTMSVPSGGIA